MENDDIKELYRVYKTYRERKELYDKIYGFLMQKENKEINSIKAYLISELEKNKMASINFASISIIVSLYLVAVNYLVDYIKNLNISDAFSFIVIIVFTLAITGAIAKIVSRTTSKSKYGVKRDTYILCVIKDIEKEANER
ncbi:hypothetical protein MCG98_15420 [Ruminococcus sp. OA3]|uniref:hypothetical protein n=1 Tax=Ruminococcus sp. OA3 TaxID=2914164 RepID=UPI001F06B65D|nr:hypothetical protein [Ruminococcus sp. OA3]MCH1983959.1 hypothetical protein [Ruminococcus sp. OA3]